ncbi:DUF397 domain-containing protein [Streptomyces sp. NPDC060030]|uniref:DUF397 domain-containing protein n=1 Tax=Streptomyces sp. NPDC060030 TaxID=3347042 RepID=UPI0036AA5E68
MDRNPRGRTGRRQDPGVPAGVLTVARAVQRLEARRPAPGLREPGSAAHPAERGRASVRCCSRTGLVQEQLQRCRGGDCVEVANAPAAVHVRDSNDLAGPVLTLSPAAWNGFIGLAPGRTA